MPADQQILLDKAKIESLLADFKEAAERKKEKLARDARVLGKLHTFQGRRRTTPAQLVPAALSRMGDLLRSE